jgi:carbonic anhydrase
MSIDDLLANNEAYAGPGPVPAAPGRALAIVTCMDARIDVFAMLGMRLGDAHVIRNAGGVATEDAIRSLAISQRLLGTRTVLLVQHTQCGLLSIDDEEFRAELRDEVGQAPPWSTEAFDDLNESVRRSVERVRTDPFLLTDEVRGFVYDVDTGKLREVG